MTNPCSTITYQPDWTREQRRRGVFEPWKAMIRSLRRYQALSAHPLAPLLRPWLVLAHRFWSVVCAADIPINATIEGGLQLIHPNGIVLHPDARIGPNCLILQQVTIGTGPKPGVPHIGANVLIGAGAKVLGGVRVGDRARIGANAVVIDDVPDGATAVGIPAKIVREATV